MEEKEANETIADIVAEMRFGLLSATVECEECGEVREQRFRFDGIADRIEAAWKREREAIYGMLDSSIKTQRRIEDGKQ